MRLRTYQLNKILQSRGIEIYRERCLAVAVSSEIDQKLRKQLSASLIKTAFYNDTHSVFSLYLIDRRLERSVYYHLHVVKIHRYLLIYLLTKHFCTDKHLLFI